MKQIVLSLAAGVVLLAGAAHAQQEAAATPPAVSTEVQQFQKVEDQWSVALAKSDQYTLELLMSPVFVGISSTGEVSTRNQEIAALYEKSGPQPVSMEQRVVNVRTVEDVTIVDGTYIQKTKLNGVLHEERGIFTHVFQHNRGNWVCIHAQRTAVVEKGPDKKTKAPAQTADAQPAKKSSAELPFHIPLLFKGRDSSQPAPAPGSTPPPSL